MVKIVSTIGISISRDEIADGIPFDNQKNIPQEPLVEERSPIYVDQGIKPIKLRRASDGKK